mgnify:FL=1
MKATTLAEMIPKSPVRVAVDDDGATQVLLIVSHELAGPEVLHVYFAWKAVALENIPTRAVVAAVPVHEETSWLNA